MAVQIEADRLYVLCMFVPFQSCHVQVQNQVDYTVFLLKNPVIFYAYMFGCQSVYVCGKLNSRREGAPVIIINKLIHLR